jgi:hypothetical protein
MRKATWIMKAAPGFKVKLKKTTSIQGKTADIYERQLEVQRSSCQSSKQLAAKKNS